MNIGLGEGLRDFTQQDELSDVVIIVEGQRLHLHRQYLAEWSPVWRTMFVSNFRERSANEIELPGKTLTEMVELLHCIYPSQKSVTDHNVSFLLELAEEYQITSIKQRCESFLMSKDRSMHTLVLAQKFNMQKLYSRCIEHVKTQTLEDIEGDEDYKHLDAETKATIYKAKIDMMRNYANHLQQNEGTLQRENEKLVTSRDRLQNKVQGIQKLWDTPNKRCYKHMTSPLFDYSCKDCNEKIHREVKKLCSGEQVRIQLSNLGFR